MSTIYTKGSECVQKSENRLFGTAAMMVAVTLLAKVFGMLRDILTASHFGTTEAAVAYEAASRLPITLFDFALGGVVTAAFIPIFNEILAKQGRSDAFAFANRYFTLILTVTVTITAAGVLLAKPLVGFLAPEISVSAKELAVPLCRMMFPMIIFTGAAYCYVGILQSFEKYMLPAVMSLVSNLVMVLYFYTLCDRLGVWGLSAALVLGWFLQAAIQAPAAHRLGFCYRPARFLGDVYIRRALKLALPILVCSWLQPVCNVINTRYASGFEGGSGITMVSYANRLYIIIVGIFSFVATNLLFPKLSRAEAAGDADGARRFASASIKILLLIMVPLAIGVFLLAEPITRAVYMRDRFSAHDAEMTAQILRLFALGIPFMSANEVLTKLFFAKQRVKAPMLSSLAAILVNIALCAVLVRTVGFVGIGIASTAAIAVCALLNLALLSRGGALLTGRDFADILKILVCTAVMGAAVFAFDRFAAPQNDLLRVLCCGAVGIAVYGAAGLILPTAEIRSLKERILKRSSHD